MPMINEAELRSKGIQSITEVKFENTISRTTSVANPRQIERAVRGSKFAFDLMYEAEEESEILEDMETLAEGMKLIQYDYIGGNGSRGYGKVVFDDINLNVVIGSVSEEIIAKSETAINEAISR